MVPSPAPSSPENRRAALAAPRLAAYLPLVYVAWADGDLEPAEVADIRSRLAAVAEPGPPLLLAGSGGGAVSRRAGRPPGELPIPNSPTAPRSATRLIAPRSLPGAGGWRRRGSVRWGCPGSTAGGDPAAFLAAFETLGHHDLSLLVKLGVQFGLFAGAIQQLGAGRHHAAYLPAAARLDLAGCFP